MKKKIWIPVISLIAILVILFVPIPKGTLNDGGTRVYSALTYKLVSWRIAHDDGIYKNTKVYFGKEARRSIDSLYDEESLNIESVVRATVVEINGSSVLIRPLASEWESNSARLISINTEGFDDIGAEVGSFVEVCYKGYVMETYPAQIDATGWRKATTLRDVEYSKDWIDKSSSEKYNTVIFSDIVITEIYSNCFFASTVIPMPYAIKINGSLSEDWCVGDQVICQYENTYYDDKNHRVECDLISIEASDWEPDPFVAYKPVIYLYPQEPAEVSIKLSLNGELTCTYPSYENGWLVTAYPDGKLIDKRGQEYNYLYWEGEIRADYDLSEGFCVKGEDTASFLEKALAELGLDRREANEFIVFWLPLMQNNPYNIITFQDREYTDSAELEVFPAPDTVIRVFMAWQASDVYVEMTEPKLTAPEREGFTIVEWGGTEIK